MRRRPYQWLMSCVMLFLVACGDKDKPGTSTQPPVVVKGVSLETARMTEQPVVYEAVGTVKAGISSHLGSKLLATVTTVRVREGDRVKQGETLILLDQRQVSADLRRAEAGVAEAQKALQAAISARDSARASEKLAQATHERYANLRRQESVSQQEFDEVQARYAQAKAATAQADAMVEGVNARVHQAEAGVKGAKVSSGDALITSPHDGIITGKFVDPGDLARPGTPLLAIETTQGFCVDVVVPETYIQHVEPQQEVGVKVPSLTPDPLRGKVCTIIPNADPQSRSFIVKITLPVEVRATSGLFARVEIPLGHSKDLLIPRSAVIVRGQLTGLYQVDPEGIARFRLIRVGRAVGNRVEVFSGLKEGDRFLSNPPPGLADGSRVEGKS